mgnify:CR=1 FL=1
MAHAFGLRAHGLPSLDLWDRLLPHKPALFGHEDNQAMMRVVETGKNPSMRHIGITHGTSVAWLHECHKCKQVRLADEVSDKMAADIHTKAFTDAAKWEHAQQLINIFDPTVLNNMNQSFVDKLTPVMDFDQPSQLCNKKGQQTAAAANAGTNTDVLTRPGQHSPDAWHTGEHVQVRTPTTSRHELFVNCENKNVTVCSPQITTTIWPFNADLNQY